MPFPRFWVHRLSVFIYLIALVLTVPVLSEELKDVWHYDLGVARIGELPAVRSERTGHLHHTGNTSNGFESPRARHKSEKTNGSEAGGHKGEWQTCDFGGGSLRVAVSPQPPFVSCIQNLYGDWICNGSNIELIHVLERQFNFRSDWVVLANNHLDDDLRLGGRGGKHAPTSPRMASRNQTFGHVGDSELPQSSGIFNLVSTGRVLLSANGVMKTMDRSDQKLIVSEPFDAFRLHFLLSKSVRDHDHIFIKPFDPNAWLAILASAALVVPVFYLINTTTAYYAGQDDSQLRAITYRQCWQHLRDRFRIIIGKFSRVNRSVSMSSTDLLLDGEISKLLEIQTLSRMVPGPEPYYFGRVESTHFSNGLASRVPPPLIRGENERKRRLMRRQWAYERRRARKLSRLKRKSGFFNVAYVVWYVVASLANQGGETEDLPRANSTRILIAFWWLYMIVICAIHSGILTAILTFPKQNDFIQTLDDYLNLEPSERASLRLSVDKYSELAHFLIDSDNLHKSSLQELQKQRVPISYVNFQRHRQRILDEVQMGQSAFIEERSIITQIISQEYYDSKQTKCLFKSSRYPIDVIPMSLILSEKMPQVCVNSINALLRQIMKTGLAQKWRRRYESQGNDCLQTVVINAGDVDKIELRHVILAFWLLALGSALGLLFLVLEIVWLFTLDDDDDDDDDDEHDHDEEELDADSSSRGGHSNSSSSSSSSASSLISSTSEESDRVRLGFRRALMPTGQRLEAIRSLKARQLPIKTILRKTKRNQLKKRTGPSGMPKITFSLEDTDQATSEPREEKNEEFAGQKPAAIAVVVDEREGLREVRKYFRRRIREKRQLRTAKEAEKRAKRFRKTLDLVRKIHDGKIYTERTRKRV